MAERNYRKYTEVFKQEALALLKQGQKRAGQLEQELGITPGLMSKWQVRYQAVEQGTESSCRAE
jgi:transposase-like protein